MSSIHVSIRTTLRDLPQATEEEMGLKICVADCFDRLIRYQARRLIGPESTRGILSLCRQTLVEILFFIDPQANSQLGMAMELMGIPCRQIRQVYPEEKAPWCQVAWILLWTVHGIQGRDANEILLIPELE